MIIRKILEKIKKRIYESAIKLDDFVYSIPTKSKNEYEFLIENIINNGIPKAINFDFQSIKKETLKYLKSLQVDNEFFKYKFSASQQIENIYSSAYACLVLDMYGEIQNLSDEEKTKWIKYFDSFQRENDGLWYDKNLANEHYDDSDWWGARHLAIHMIAAYTALGALPKYKINFVKKYYDTNIIKTWLDGFDWNGFFDHSNDIDNKLMNVMVILQFNRDFYDDTDARKSLDFIYSYLDGKFNPSTGMWGKTPTTKYELSRTVQFAYHLLMPYFYDKKEISFSDKILELTLKTQNRLGGYGEKLNSSACEDIDSVDILLYLGKDDEKIEESIKKAFVWILSNQNEDGGFVFRRNESMWYGHNIMTAKKNESHLFATWFRTLSIAKVANHLKVQTIYKINHAPSF